MGVTPFISVIVPIYNVAPYIRKCLNSLKNQTMREIEIICIDDGSTDGSGRIAEEYASVEFPIFRIIHTENRGLSAARNCGIDEAKAEWLMFVDSDDWVDERFCEIPYKAAVDNNADLAIFEWDIKKRKTIDKNNAISLEIVSEMVAHERGDTVAWNKLYRKTVLNGVRYPEGRVFEDTATTHKIVHQSKTIILLQSCIYYHPPRKNSITHNKSEKNTRDSLISALERREDLLSYGYPRERIHVESVVIKYLVRTYPNDDMLYKKAVDIVNSFSGIPELLTKKQKIAFGAWKIDKRLFLFICRFSGRMKITRVRE